LFAALCLGAGFELFALLVMTAGFSRPRYDTVPVLLLITAFAALVDTDGFGRGRRPHVPVVALCVLLAGNLAANYAIGTNQDRAQSPGWVTQVTSGEAACEQYPELASVILLTAPGGDWEVTVPCNVLVPGARPGHSDLAPHGSERRVPRDVVAERFWG
jgi:hypothetical protein